MMYREQMIEKLLHNGNFINLGIISGIVTIVGYFIIYVICRGYYGFIDKTPRSIEQRARDFAFKSEWIFSEVMEIMLSNTCIFGMLYIYQFITKIPLFSDYNGLILLALIVIGVIVNNIIDKNWLEKKWERSDDFSKSNLRLISSVLVLLLIFAMSLYLHINNCIQLELCIFSLVLGRFIYFDMSLRNIIKELKETLKYWISLIMVVILLFIILIISINLNLIDKNNIVGSLFLIHVSYMMSSAAAMGVANEIL